MYPIEIVKPMKEELTEVGFVELLNKNDVESMLQEKGTCFVVINSVCGCAAGAARPSVLSALEKSDKKPTHIFTTFAGYDVEAVATLRERMKPYPPSSPSMALFKDGKLVHFIERHHIEGSSVEMLVDNILEAFKQHC